MRLASLIIVASLLPAALTAQERDGALPNSVQRLQQTVAQDPKHPTAWKDLCHAYLELDQIDDAVRACQTQVEVNPKSPDVYDLLGQLLVRQGKNDEAIAAFRRQIELDPRAGVAHGALGRIYCDLGRYPEAVAELEAAVAAAPYYSAYQASLGDAYLGVGQTDKGLALLVRLANQPVPTTLDEVARALAAHRVRLDLAQQYAESAVNMLEAGLVKEAGEPITAPMLRRIVFLANCWDTLGWVYFSRENLDQARKFITAAWSLNPDRRIVDHMRQIKQPARAGAPISAGKLFAGNASAVFYVVQSQPPPAAKAQFVRGDERLRQFAPAVEAATPAALFPDAAPVRIIRRVTLTCPGQELECSIELQSAPAAVHGTPEGAMPGGRHGGTGVSAPTPTFKPQPEYSEEARANKIEGTVTLYIEVDTNGHPRNIKVTRGLGYGLDEKAIEAVSRWEFRPGMKDGRAVTVAATVMVNFRLGIGH